MTEAMEIWDGTNGNLLFTTIAFSATRAESPVVVDVDGDGLTEILVSGSSSQGDVNNDNGLSLIHI